MENYRSGGVISYEFAVDFYARLASLKNYKGGKMITVKTGVWIDKPPAVVFAFISNFENNPKWQSGQIEARFTSDGPLGIGSTYEQVAKFLGRQIVSTFEVIAYEPGQMVKASSTAGSFPITFTRMAAAEAEGTKVTAVIKGDASGFYKLAETVMARMVQRSVDKDYQNLKKILEEND